MISLHRSATYEVIDLNSPAYNVVSKNIVTAKKELPSYIPLLLGVIRQNLDPEFLFDPNAYKALNGKKYYCIDYYFSLDGTKFHHTTSLGYNEQAPNKEALIACFDPKQEAARVRFVLDCLKNGLENPALFWMPRLLEEPVTDANKDDFKNLLRHLKNVDTDKYPEFQKSLKNRIDPCPPAIVRTTNAVTEREQQPAKPSSARAVDFVKLAKQHETANPPDPFAAERYYYRALHFNPRYSPAIRGLALLYYSGKILSNVDLNLCFDLLTQSYKYAPANYEVNRALAEIYYTAMPNNKKAIKHLKAALAKNPEDSWAIWALACTNNRIQAEKQAEDALAEKIAAFRKGSNAIEALAILAEKPANEELD